MTTTSAQLRRSANGTWTVRRAARVGWVSVLGAVVGLACTRFEAASGRLVVGPTRLPFAPPAVDTTAGRYDAVMAQRGQVQFTASCASCHTRPSRGNPPRGSPPRGGVPFIKLRDLWRHAPYFADGSAATLVAVVEHYDGTLHLRLSKASQGDLVEYLKSR